MKYFILILSTSFIITSCGNPTKKGDSELSKLKQERSLLDEKIKKLEEQFPDSNVLKTASVSILEVQKTDFKSFIEVQSNIIGDQNVLASSQAPGTIKQIVAKLGQHVSKGQVLAVLDATAIEQQINAVNVQIGLLKSVYEKQDILYKQDIGSEIQLMQSKAAYDGAMRQKDVLVAQKNMYRIVSPINGIVDNIPLKVGDIVSPGMVGIRVVNFDQLKAEAHLGENYIGKVKENANVSIILPDINDSIQTKLSYVGRQIDPISRTFLVQVRLANNSKIYPNMSCRLKIANYENKNAIVVPIKVIQKTAEGDMLYIANGNKAKAIIVTQGNINNGMVEILSGLNEGDKVIVVGYNDLNNNDPIQIL